MEEIIKLQVELKGELARRFQAVYDRYLPNDKSWRGAPSKAEVARWLIAYGMDAAEKSRD